MQRVTPGIRDAFGTVEKELQDTFLPVLFKGLGEGSPGIRVTCLSVKRAGLALPYPTNTAPENWTTTCVITGRLIVALRGQVELRMEDHSACLQ